MSLLICKKVAYDFSPIAVVYFDKAVSVWKVTVRMPGKLPGIFFFNQEATPTEDDAKKLIEDFSKMK
jgi:hypothetical protein